MPLKIQSTIKLIKLNEPGFKIFKYPLNHQKYQFKQTINQKTVFNNSLWVVITVLFN